MCLFPWCWILPPFAPRGKAARLRRCLPSFALNEGWERPPCSCAVAVYNGDECGIRFRLMAVVVHQGRLNSGHYSAYVRVGGVQLALVPLAPAERRGWGRLLARRGTRGL
jgi:hypothetical protein